MNILEGRTDNAPSLAERRRYYKFGVVGYWCGPAYFVSLGIHLDWRTPTLDLHLPWLTIQIGRVAWHDGPRFRLNTKEPREFHCERCYDAHEWGQPYPHHRLHRREYR